MQHSSEKLAAMERVLRSELLQMREELTELRRRIASTRRALKLIAWYRSAEQLLKSMRPRPPSGSR